MRSLIRFLIRNHAFLLFVVLEVVSVVFVLNYNSFQRARYLNTSNAVSGRVYATFSSITQYFELATVNRNISEENVRLRNTIDRYQNLVGDSVLVQEQVDSTFSFISARIINNSVNKQQNYITLNKGRKDGIKSDQGIISSQGVVGIVTNVSESFSMGLSVLNPRWSVSAKLKKSGFYGSLIWDGKDYREVELREIPFHIDLAVGDTVVTSGYSSVFPEGLMIGTISDFSQPAGENYYVIKVALAADLKSATYVEVIENTNIDELKELKTATEYGTAGN